MSVLFKSFRLLNKFPSNFLLGSLTLTNFANRSAVCTASKGVVLCKSLGCIHSNPGFSNCRYSTKTPVEVIDDKKKEAEEIKQQKLDLVNLLADEEPVIGGDFDMELVNSPFYVDKSDYIKVVMNDSKVIMITAPKRFCKTTNLQMLRRFSSIIQTDENGNQVVSEFDENKNLKNADELENFKIFKRLKIFEDKAFFKKNFAQHPVLFLDLRNVGSFKTYQSFLDSFQSMVRNSFAAHRFLLKSENLATDQKATIDRYISNNFQGGEITTGLMTLTSYLRDHFRRKVVVIIDEFDCPTNTAIRNFDLDDKEFEAICEFLQQTMGLLLKGNDSIRKGVLSGCSRYYSPHLNNVISYPFPHPKYSQYYGLTESELELLLKLKGLDSSKDKVLKWYNGYEAFGKSPSRGKIVNLWSVMHYLRTGKLKCHWTSGIPELSDFKNLLLSREMRIKLENLLKGQVVHTYVPDKVSVTDLMSLKKLSRTLRTKEILKDKYKGVNETAISEEVEKNHNIIFRTLLEHGYLTISSPAENENSNECLKISNREVKIDLGRILYDSEI